MRQHPYPDNQEAGPWPRKVPGQQTVRNRAPALLRGTHRQRPFRGVGTAGIRLDPRQRTHRASASQARNGHTDASSRGARDEAWSAAVSGGDIGTDREFLRRWGRYAGAIARWERITGRPAPAPTILNEISGPHPAPVFVEWLMGLNEGWITYPMLGLTHAQQLTTLGNGVLPKQAEEALRALEKRSHEARKPQPPPAGMP